MVDWDAAAGVLRTTELTARVSDGWVRDICVAGHRAIDAIYVAVRDDQWKTVPGRMSGFRVSSTAAGFSASWTVRHQGSGIDFSWEGQLEAASGSVVLTMWGEALSTFDTHRIGLCVLHPIELVGTPVRTAFADGSAGATRFPESIDPSPVVSGIQDLSYELVPDVRISVHFTGEQFEMEDHRNWTDAGWKTYCPPLADSATRRVAAGERIRQSVRVTPIVGPSVDREDCLPAEPLEVTVGSVTGVLPEIGVVFADAGEREAATLEALSVRLLHVELIAGDDWSSRLDAAVEAARAARARLSVSLVGADGAWLAACASKVGQQSVPISAVTVLGVGHGVAAGHLVRTVRDELRSAGRSTAVGGGSGLHFAELNRSHGSVGDWDFVAFAVCAQVHHTDDTLVMETVLGQRAAVTDAGALTGGLPVAVGPVSLRRRAGSAAPPDPRDPRDPRESADFGAAWVWGSVSAMSEASRIVFLNPLLDGNGCASADSPVTGAFRTLSKLAGASVRRVQSNRRRLGVLAVDRPGTGPLVIVANLRPQSVRVQRNARERNAREQVLGPYEVATWPSD